METLLWYQPSSFVRRTLAHSLFAFHCYLGAIDVRFVTLLFFYTARYIFSAFSYFSLQNSKRETV